MEPIDQVTPPVVCDAGPLIHLDELGCLDLLADFARVLIPKSVRREVAAHRPSALTHPAITIVTASPIDTPPHASLETLSRSLPLHIGEIDALRLALGQKEIILLTDDTAARLAAANLGIAVHGTIGVLVRSIRRGRRTAQQILATLESLPHHSTLHLRKSLLEAVIQEVKLSI